jgi:hypothetical protein
MQEWEQARNHSHMYTGEDPLMAFVSAQERHGG